MGFEAVKGVKKSLRGTESLRSTFLKEKSVFSWKGLKLQKRGDGAFRFVSRLKKVKVSGALPALESCLGKTSVAKLIADKFAL